MLVLPTPGGPCKSNTFAKILISFTFELPFDFAHSYKFQNSLFHLFHSIVVLIQNCLGPMDVEVLFGGDSKRIVDEQINVVSKYEKLLLFSIDLRISLTQILNILQFALH